MAKSEIMIRGRIGNMIFYRVRGVTRIRSVPLSAVRPDALKCRTARLRLIAAVRFYQRLQDSRFRDIWRMAAKDTAINGYNLFVKQNIHVFNDRTLFDPVRLQLVFGALPPMNCLELSEQTGRRIVLTWKNSLEPAGIRASDRASRRTRSKTTAATSKRSSAKPTSGFPPSCPTANSSTSSNCRTKTIRRT